MTDQFVILKTVIQSLGYMLSTLASLVVVRVQRVDLTEAPHILAIRKMFKKTDSLAFLALLSGLDGMGIPLLFVWKEHWVLRASFSGYQPNSCFWSLL